MENPNTPTPSGMTPGAASAGSGQTSPRRFLVQFKMTACEEYSAPTPAAALSDAENSDAPPLGDFTSDEGPEIVAEWDPVAEYWGDVRPPRPWNGIDENTRDPLELDDDAPAQPSELDDAASAAAPDLSAVPLDVLAAELFRRDCCAVIISLDDLAEYWESDESGATHPGSATPTPEEMRAVRRGFEGWLDCGNFTEIMQVCRDAWNDAKEKGGSK